MAQEMSGKKGWKGRARCAGPWVHTYLILEAMQKHRRTQGWPDGSAVCVVKWSFQLTSYLGRQESSGVGRMGFRQVKLQPAASGRERGDLT